MNKNKYDLIVIGAGSGGLGAALGMLKLGFRALLINKKSWENWGKISSYYTGFVPGKTLLHGANQVHQAKISSRFELEITEKYDIQKVKVYIKEENIRLYKM